MLRCKAPRRAPPTMLTFKVPAGIGDIAWLYGKLRNIGREFALQICGDAPRRSEPFVSLLPGVKNLGYGDFSYHPTFVRSQLGLPADTDPRQLPLGEYFLSCNQHVDAGHRIEQFLPALEMSFHYDLATTDEHRAVAERILKGLVRPPVLVYTSKYNRSGDWIFWGPGEWAEFLDKVALRMGGASFVVIGADFDGELGPQTARALQTRGHEVRNVVGETHIGEVVELIKRVSYFFAYPSGLGILGDVLSCPTMMFLPTPRHDKLKDSYADPANIDSGRHINHLFSSPAEAFRVWQQKGLDHFGVRV